MSIESEHQDDEFENYARERLLSTASVCERYDHCSPMTIWRWSTNPESGFPKPIRIGPRKFWRLSDLIEYEKACAAKSATKPPAPTPPRRNTKRDDGNTRIERPRRKSR